MLYGYVDEDVTLMLEGRVMFHQKYHKDLPGPRCIVLQSIEARDGGPERVLQTAFVGNTFLFPAIYGCEIAGKAALVEGSKAAVSEQHAPV